LTFMLREALLTLLEILNAIQTRSDAQKCATTTSFLLLLRDIGSYRFSVLAYLRSCLWVSFIGIIIIFLIYFQAYKTKVDISVAAFLKEQERNREKNGTEETDLEKIEREHAEGHTKFRSLQVRFVHKMFKIKTKLCPLFEKFRLFFTII
jgi:hypothetical protein